MSTVQAVSRPQAEPDSVARRNSEGHGRRLTAAFYALDTYPALAESRSRVLRLFADERSAPGDLIAAVESDVALAISVLRLANRGAAAQGRVDTVVAALDVAARREAAHAGRPRCPPSTSSSAAARGT